MAFAEFGQHNRTSASPWVYARLLLALLAASVLMGCTKASDIFQASFEIHAPADPHSFHAEASVVLAALGWEPQGDPRFGANEESCVMYKDWWRQRGHLFWWNYDGIYLVITCNPDWVSVGVTLSDRTKPFEEKLDEYYELRNTVFPEILGLPVDALDIRTTRHPARYVPVESLAAFDREPLDDAQKRRLAQWEAGELPSTQQARRARFVKALREQGPWYGVPALIGTVVLVLVWRFVVLRRRFSVTAKRALFVGLGTLAWAPAPMPMLPVTTVGATLFWPVPFFLVFLIPLWIVTGTFLIPAAVAIVLWIMSLWLFRRQSQRTI